MLSYKRLNKDGKRQGGEGGDERESKRTELCLIPMKLIITLRSKTYIRKNSYNWRALENELSNAVSISVKAQRRDTIVVKGPCYLCSTYGYARSPCSQHNTIVANCNSYFSQCTPVSTCGAENLANFCSHLSTSMAFQHPPRERQRITGSDSFCK